MADPTRCSRRPVALVGAAGLAIALALAGCSSSGGDAASGGTTIASTSVPAGSSTSATTAGTATTEPSGPIPTSPSTLPASVDGTCAALAETYGLDEIQPKDSSSWVDERQRILVDAQREAQLLATAQQGAPADVAAHLATMQTYASWLATTVEGSAGFSEAVSAIDAYPDSVAVTLAIASVSTWRAANCPS